MATVAVTPRILRKYKLTVDADDYEAATESVLFTPSTSPQTWTGGDGETHSDTSPANWNVAIGYMQDWDTPGSLGEFLHAHEGEQVDITFRPDATAGPSFTSTVTVTPGAIGGSNGAWPTTTTTLPCTKPVLVPAA
ncbi:hypothetical protein [Cellulosimicrobium sp. 22601]|uniref:hypothetical protein n=1 Tax=unclassified Cellulosimicrobium TaxID=2624466 RepID=UPI003F824C64